MGVPIKSVKSFEDDIKYRYNKNWTLVIIANADSDSRAVEFIKRNFHVMDTLSRGVHFYLPGYDVEQHVSPFFSNRQDKWKSEMEEREFEDSHLREFHTEVIRSPRLGRISFNEAEFADFVMEFTCKIPGYAYWGICQMILIPIDSERKPNYDIAKVFDLDSIINTPGNLSLDAFLHHTFNILREERDYSLDERLLCRQNNILNNISGLYHEATSVTFNDDRYEIVVRNVIIDMERCLHWSLHQEFFFISYSSRNVMIAEMLKETMQDRGLNVWMAPDGIPQGRDYSLVVPTALRFAKNFVLILTEDSANSRWVKRELDIAISNEANTKVKVLFAEGYTIERMRERDDLRFYLNKVQIKYEYNDILYNREAFEHFVSE